MVFDKSKPTNSSKIRNLGEEIRPNWAAIEAAADTFKPEGLNLDKNAVDRTAIADAIVMYNKNNQLYAIDPSSVVTQLTGGYTKAATGYTYIPGGIIIQWGPFAGSNVGIVNTFALTFPNNCWSVVVTGSNAGQPTNVCKATLLTTVKFTGRCPAGEAGYYIAIGN